MLHEHVLWQCGLSRRLNFNFVNYWSNIYAQSLSRPGRVKTIPNHPSARWQLQALMNLIIIYCHKFRVATTILERLFIVLFFASILVIKATSHVWDFIYQKETSFFMFFFSTSLPYQTLFRTEGTHVRPSAHTRIYPHPTIRQSASGPGWWSFRITAAGCGYANSPPPTVSVGWVFYVTGRCYAKYALVDV